MKAFDLTGKKAIVTGAGRGLGREIALTLAGCGADVWIADLIAENAQGVAAEITALGRGSGWSKVDVSKREEMVAAFEVMTASFGALDIVVNAVCPGVIRTAMWEKILDDVVAQNGGDREEVWAATVTYQIPLKRAQTTRDIADAVLFFCSDFAENITGQALNVDGGMKMN